MLCFRQLVRLAWAPSASSLSSFTVQMNLSTQQPGFTAEESDDESDLDDIIVEAVDNPDERFQPHPQIPGFYLANKLLPPKEYTSMLAICRRLGQGEPEPSSRGVYSSLEFPEEAQIYEQTEAALLSIINRIPFLDSHPVVGVVFSRIDVDGSSALHRHDTKSYGDVICTVGLGSAAVLQMQNTKATTGGRVVERVLLNEGSAYVMSEDARNSWLHGLEGGESVEFDDRKIVRQSTRFELLLTPPKGKFSGTVLIKHRGFPGGAAICMAEHGAVFLDAPEPVSIDEVLKQLDLTLDS